MAIAVGPFNVDLTALFVYGGDTQKRSAIVEPKSVPDLQRLDIHDDLAFLQVSGLESREQIVEWTLHAALRSGFARARLQTEAKATTADMVESLARAG